MPSFSEGFAKALGGQIGEETQSRRQGMLELQMLSHKIEMEQQAHMAEVQQEHELNLMPPGAFASMAPMLGVDPDKAAAVGKTLEGLFPNGMPQSLGQSVLTGMAMGNRIPGDMPVKTGVDQNGQDVFSIFNKKVGQWQPAPQPPDRGLSSKASGEIADARKSYGEINGILDSVENLSNKVINAADAQGLVGQALTNKVNQYLQNDKGAAATYNDELLGHAQRYEYLIAHNGRMNADLIHGAVAGFPAMLTDTQDTKNSKLAVLRGLNTNMLTSSYTAWNQPMPQDLLDQHAGASGTALNAYKAGMQQGHQLGTAQAQSDAMNSYLSSVNSQLQGK